MTGGSQDREQEPPGDSPGPWDEVGKGRDFLGNQTSIFGFCPCWTSGLAPGDLREAALRPSAGEEAPPSCSEVPVLSQGTVPGTESLRTAVRGQQAQGFTPALYRVPLRSGPWACMRGKVCNHVHVCGTHMYSGTHVRPHQTLIYEGNALTIASGVYSRLPRVEVQRGWKGGGGQARAWPQWDTQSQPDTQPAQGQPRPGQGAP